MVKFIFVFLLLVHSVAVFSQEKSASTLEELLEQIKNNRVNDVVHKIPKGIHWIEGYCVSNAFYRCSEKHPLYINDGSIKKALDDMQAAVLHVEMTIKNKNGSITILEVHNIIEGHKQGCTYLGEPA